MKKHHELTLNRIRKFHARLKASYYYKNIPLKVGIHKSKEPLTWDQAQKVDYEPIEPDTKWGYAYDCAWFKLEGEVPKDMAGQYVVALVDVGGEACLFDDNGNPVQGLTNKRIEWTMTETIVKKRIHLFPEAKGGEKVSMMIDAGANNILGVKNVLTYESMVDGIFNQADLAVFDREKWHLRLDVELLLQMVIELPSTSRHRKLILYALNEACNQYGDGTADEVANCRATLAVELNKRANASALKVSAIGHAHIDVAWLWPLRETVRKTSRTFSTALRLMESYPDYKFGASQPVLYEMMKETFPDFYKRIKDAVARKQWECQGAMWVEADCNLTSGESLVRQFLYGKKFYQEEFGVDVKNLWLPDVFGYSAALPQLMKKSGVDYFMSQKMSWNQFNKFPHNTFIWEGIDGTEVFTHFIAPNNYRSDCSAMDLMNLERTNDDIDRSEHALFLYGAGDGGGGPSRVYLEKLKRVADLEDMPQVTLEFAEDFFEKASKTAFDLPKWQGELYLELHRGTLTTQAMTKKMNRKLEFLFRKVEMLYALYNVSEYPQAELDKHWKVLLMNQFHDIIPGTSINRVHQESVAQYREIEEALNELTSKLLGDSRGSLVLNQLSSSVEGIIDDSNGNPVRVHVPSFGFFELSECITNSEDTVVATNNSLENNLIKVEFASDGTISSIFDKEVNREAIAAGQFGNQLNLYEDRPVMWDAWDVDVYYEEKEPQKPELVSSEVLESNKLRSCIQQVYRSEHYDLTQKIYLYADSKRIDFVTTVDWREDYKMLRAEFPVNVKSDRASFEIQYGHTFRNTHSNTTWDMAQFEVVGHKWADLSQHNYGVAILNDCKYGHKIKDGLISLNLLRAAKEPDHEADMHVHEFTYSLFPHVGNHLDGRVIEESYALNIPLELASQNDDIVVGSQLSVEADNVILEACKKSESGDEIVFRFYEAYGTDVSACKIYFGFPVKKVELISLIEEYYDNLKVDDNAISMDFGPFEIHTIKVTKA